MYVKCIELPVCVYIFKENYCLFFLSVYIIIHYKRIGYNLNVVRHSPCLIFNPITIDYYHASLFNCAPVGSGVRLYDGPDLKLFPFLLSWGGGI